jgi:hypothetical protein
VPLSAVVTTTLRALWHSAAALALAAGLLVVAGQPAHAVNAHGIETPAAGEKVTSAITVVAFVDAHRFEQVESVQLRLLRGGTPVGAPRGMSHAGGERTDDRSRWTTSLDPMASWATDGRPMPNGTYSFQVRVTATNPAGEEMTRWDGHEAVLDVAPPSTGVSARVVDAATRSVEVSWDQATVPDFTRYTVQRRGDGEDWADIATMTTASTTRFVDVVPQPGHWAYRVIVARVGGSGGERTSTSGEYMITVDGPPVPEAPEAMPGEPGPDGGSPSGENPEDGQDGERGDGDDASGEGDEAGGGGGTGSGGSRFGQRPGTGRSPSIGSTTVPDVGAPARPSGESPNTAPPRYGPGTDVFVEELPYDVDLPEEIEVTERQTIVEPGERIDGGTLSIYDRELQLEEVLPPLAGGLLLFVAAGHVLRLRR